MNIAFTKKSQNKKVGRIPVSTSPSFTCPSECPLYKNGCYADNGPLGWFGKKVDAGIAGMGWDAFVANVKALPEGQIWRHNQKGDLPGNDNDIDVTMLRELVEANRGRRGFTYTHKPVINNVQNAEAVKHANENGFTINLSADNKQEADNLMELGIGPVVVVLPQTQVTNTVTPAGRKIVVCPATIRENVTCPSCKLCSKVNRDIIIGFPAHGNQKKKASAIAGA